MEERLPKTVEVLMITRGSKTGVLIFGEFLSYLRNNGFLIGVDQYLNLQAVLDRVGSDATIDELRTLLCPLFATNKDQQEQFYRAFDQIFDITPPAIPIAPVPSAREDPDAKKQLEGYIRTMHASLQEMVRKQRGICPLYPFC